jgi:predicted O-linked N-acetylglucosamine transferase (SPINDLY family)
LLKLDRFDEAIVSLDKALKHSPNHVKALNNRGLAHMAQQHWRDALEDFNKAIALDPEDPELYFNKGQAAWKHKALQIAELSFAQAIKLDPKHAEAWVHRAFCLDYIKRNEEATVCFQRYMRLRPDAPFLHGYLHSSRMHLCDWSDYEESAASAMKKVEKGEPVMVPHSITLLPSKRQHQKQAAEFWVKSHFGNIKPKPFAESFNRKDEKIRVAYFSADFHNHPVTILSSRLLELHNRKDFEIFAFSLGAPTRDPMRLRIESGVDHFINIRELTDMEVVDLAREKGIDIAVDMSGYTMDNRTGIFAMRAAPVQINYLGYSATMGADFIDYIIGDPVLIPPSHDVEYSEKVARLPDTYMPSDPTREVSTRHVTRAEYGLPDNGFVFCAFNNPYKIAPPQYDLWMQILLGVPGSVLWLSPTSGKAAENLRREARQRGVDPERIIFSNRENNLADHIARKGLADLFLDSLPHNAHATANDALWAGLPILTRLGEGFAGRVAGSLVSAVGMPDMIVADGDEYVRRAIEIATTPGLAAQLKARLAENKKTAPLFNAERYTSALEKAYVHMVERSRQGLPPESFDVSAL